MLFGLWTRVSPRNCSLNGSRSLTGGDDVRVFPHAANHSGPDVGIYRILSTSVPIGGPQKQSNVALNFPTETTCDAACRQNSSTAFLLSFFKIYFAGTPRHTLYNQAGQTSGFSNIGDIAQRHQNGGVDVDFRYPLSGPLRMRGTLDESSLSTRSSPIHRPTNSSSEFAVVCQVPRQPTSADTGAKDDVGEDPGRRRTTARVLPVPLSSWPPIGREPWWAGRHRGQWADDAVGHDRKSATLGGRRLTTVEDSDVVDRPGLSRSTACLLEARCDGRTAPVTVAISQNL